jgi:putative oxidoreductase
MFSRLERLAPQILGITRALLGVMLACHGAQKVLGAFGGVPAGTPAWIVWIAGSIELVGGALMAIGLFSRGTAFLMSGLMAAAYFMGHAPQGFWHGPGAWALDNLRTRRSAAAPALEAI